MSIASGGPLNAVSGGLSSKSINSGSHIVTSSSAVFVSSVFSLHQSQLRQTLSWPVLVPSSAFLLVSVSTLRWWILCPSTLNLPRLIRTQLLARFFFAQFLMISLLDLSFTFWADGIKLYSRFNCGVARGTSTRVFEIKCA